MAVQTFSDLYFGECENCGADLEEWEWSEDDMVFHTTCTCGSEITLEPTAGIIETDADLLDEDEENEGEC